MAFGRSDTLLGGQRIEEASSTQQHPFGTRVEAQDTTYGAGEFVYVKGVANGAVGSVVTYNPYTGVTALATTRSKGLVGVMMAALSSTTTYGWVQVSGAAVAKSATAAAGATVYLTATAGTVDDAVVAGDIVYGANYATADGTPSAGLAVLSLSYPSCADTDNA
jgi:hypothetical protein